MDYKYPGEPGPPHTQHSHRPTSQRSSLLFKEKDKSGEKLTKRMLVNEGLGRYNPRANIHFSKLYFSSRVVKEFDRKIFARIFS